MPVNSFLGVNLLNFGFKIILARLAEIILKMWAGSAGPGLLLPVPQCLEEGCSKMKMKTRWI